MDVLVLESGESCKSRDLSVVNCDLVLLVGGSETTDTSKFGDGGFGSVRDEVPPFGVLHVVPDLLAKGARVGSSLNGS